MRKIDANIFKTFSTSKQENLIEVIVFVSSIKIANLALKRKNLKIKKIYPFINALCVVGDIYTIFSISKNDFVIYISSITTAKTLVDVSKKVVNNNNKFSGKNITIAYIDTGINPHLDFVFVKNRIVKFVDLINYKESAYDDNGHGTFVAGVGSGNGLVSNGRYKGFAYNSNIISIKALDENGEAGASKILEAMQWVYDNAKTYDIKVVCMSFGSEPLGYNDPIMKGSEMLWKIGITVVAAAGNSGPQIESIKSPAVSPKIIAVGGIDDNRLENGFVNPNFYEIADFSSRGPAFRRNKPDLVTPSVNITSCKHDKNFYTTLSGTSVATPMIAGIVALGLEKNINIKPDYIKKLLLASCKPITFNKNSEGFGLINVEKFLNLIPSQKK